MTDPNMKRLLSGRIGADQYDTLRLAAAALGESLSEFVVRASLERASRNADRIAASNSNHSDEISRLSESANELIALTNRNRPGATS